MNKRLFLVTALLLVVPAVFVLSGWRWQGTEIPYAYPLFLLTQTAGKPWFALSCPLLLALLWRAHRRGELRPLLLLVLLSTGGTQVVKSVLKPIVAEPRPYVVAMFDGDAARIRDFYAEPRKLRAAAVTAYYATRSQTPPYLRAHRAHETGYSFPSGHSIFAAGWALLFAGVIGFANRRRACISAAVIIWAMGAMASRVLLGMHYPADLAAAVLLACAVHLPLLHGWQRRRAPQMQAWLRRLAFWRRSDR